MGAKLLTQLTCCEESDKRSRLKRLLEKAGTRGQSSQGLAPSCHGLGNQKPGISGIYRYVPDIDLYVPLLD